MLSCICIIISSGSETFGEVNEPLRRERNVFLIDHFKRQYLNKGNLNAFI